MTQKLIAKAVPILLCALALAGGVAGLAEPPLPKSAPKPPAGGASDREEVFEAKVRPLLLRRCGTCHSAAKASGGLDLSARAPILKGGSHGPALVPGKPEESLLLRAVTFKDAALRMPPSGRLVVEEIGVLREWIRTGALWPAGAAPKTEGPLWSLLPVRDRVVPNVRQPGWVRNPIDAFILGKLEERGMRPAPLAGRLELVRRAYFDLTGLPPSPEEVDGFLSDTRADAYERLIDRLLASPRYGERWARYWLDLVRYADSNGYERDAEKPYSWKYRDYVIRSLNADKPYDRFVTEQLAGDELAERSEETVAATGFLRLGTWDDEPNDPAEYPYERLDDLVHTTSTAFLGLTVRCARCHDHKFDPIPQKDYYALGAAFWGGFLQPGDGRYLGGPPPERLGFPVLGFTDQNREAPELHLLQGGDVRKPGPVIPPGYLSSVSQVQRTVTQPPAAAATTHRREQLAAWITDPNNPLTPRVLVNRLWQHHFGQGLVRTPNNFGRKGSPPTHPELLDWLAREFLRGGGRIKSMHRLIMLSSTYRMASVHPDQSAYSQKDYANELWWRFNRRRLDADALRDAMLAVSGELNLTVGGRGFTPSVSRAALEGLSRKGAEWGVSPPDEQRRRSVYMFLKRALIMPLMTVFDFSDTTQPVEQRDSSIVAPQALALLNNAFCQEQALALARRVRSEAGAEPSRQIERLWRLTLGRRPDAGERTTALRHLSRVAGLAQRNTAADPAPATSRTPDSLARLTLWLRADRGVTRDAAGRISGWEDGSGAGHSAVQSRESARPELASDFAHGQPALRFDGKGRWLAIRGRPLTAPGFTILAVVSDRAGGGSHREVFSNWRRADNVGPAVFLGTTGAATVRFSDAFSPAGTLQHPEQPLVLSAVTAPGGSSVFQDRTLLAESASQLPDRKLDTPYVIGQQGDIQGEYWNGDIAEVLVYDRPLGPGELESLWSYFHERYGVAARPAPAAPVDRALASLCHVLLNTNEFVFVD